MAVEFKDYYKILGSTAGRTTRRSSLRIGSWRASITRMCRRARTEQRFQEIAEAYEVLSDPEKWRRYDTLGLTGSATRSRSGRPTGAAASGGVPRPATSRSSSERSSATVAAALARGRPGGRVDVEDSLGGSTRRPRRGPGPGRPGQRRDHAGRGVQRRPAVVRVRRQGAMPDLPRQRQRERQAVRDCHGSGWQRGRHEVDVDPCRRANGPEACASRARARRRRRSLPGGGGGLAPEFERRATTST